MSLLKEAEYIYVFSKELLRLNRKLKKLGKAAEKHKKRHNEAKEDKQLRHKVRHANTVQDIEKLMGRHNQIFTRLKNHYHRFAHHLRKEHKI